MKKIILILALFLLTGCYNYNELNDLLVVSNMYISYESNFKISVEIEKNDNTIYINSEGKSIPDALNNLEEKQGKEVYYSHLKTLFIDKNVNVPESFDFFLRNTNFNLNFYIVRTNNNPFKKEKIKNNVNEILTKTKCDNFITLASKLYNENIDIIIPFFNDDGIIDKYITYDKNYNEYKLNEEEYKIYTLLNSQNVNSIYVKNINDNFTFNVRCSKAKITYKDKIYISLSLETEVTDLEIENKDAFSKDGTKYLECLTNLKLKNDIKKLLTKLKNNKTDILGINQIINNENKNLKQNLYNSDYQINVSSQIIKKGMLLK